MSWLGDLLQFDKSNFSEIWKDVKDKPQKALLGAMDPVGGKFWATLTGDESYNETPLNLLGGPSGTTWLDPWQPRNGRDMYSRAEAKGIDTKAGELGHDIAETVAIMMLMRGAGAFGGGAGGAGGGAAGGGGALGGQAASFIPGVDSAALGSSGSAIAPSSVNLVNAGGTMSTGLSGASGLSSGMGDWSNYMRQAGDAAGAAQQMGLLNFGGNQQQAPAVSLQARGDPVGEMLSQQAQLEAIRRKRKGLLG